ncbi:MAG: arabinofuranosyltransferase [Candidatus Latescibacterota bacterium]
MQQEPAPWFLRALLFTCLLVFSWQAHTYDTVQDDAYITLTYAKNLAAGEGLVFNPGERVEGYTNFLWTLILSLPHLFSIDALATARALSWLAAAATFVLTLLIGRRQVAHAPSLHLVLAPLLLATCGAFAFWATSGMETMLFTLLITGGVYRYDRELYERGTQYSPWLFALAGLTRPEGWFFFALSVLHRFVLHLQTRHFRAGEFLHWLAPALAIFAAHTLFRFAYYGHLLPNTFHAKTGTREVLLHYGWSYSLDFFSAYGFYGLALLVPLLLCLLPEHRPWRSYRALLIASHALYIILVGGDVLDAHRFYLPILPLVYLSLQDGLHHAAQRLSPHLALILTAAVLFSSAALTYALPHNKLDYAQRSMRAHNARLFKLAQCLNQSPDQDLIVATGAIGIPKYFTDAHIIDLIGLTDSTIARHSVRVPGLQSPSVLRQQNSAYVLGRRPDVICFITGLKPQTLAEKTLFLHERFRQDYYTSFCSDDVPIYTRKPDLAPDAQDAVFADPSFVEAYIAGLNASAHEAIPHYTRAIAKGPTDFADPYLWLGAIYYELNERAAAYPYFQRAIEIDPYSAWSYAYLAMIELIDEHNLERALKLSHMAATLTPRSHFSNYVHGTVLLRSNRYDEAATFLERTIALGGESTPQAQYFLGLIASQRGDKKTARQLWQTVLETRPNHEMARRNLAALETTELAPPSVPLQ